MSVRLRRNFALLKTLTRSSPKIRKVILQECPPDLIQAICEICMNLLKGNIPITQCQHHKLKRYKETIRQMACRKDGVRKKKKLLNQKGGFLLPLLTTVLPMVADLAIGAIRKYQCRKCI